MFIRRFSQDRRPFDARHAGALCSKCPLKFQNPVGPESNTNAKIVLLGDFPGSAEDKTGFPFSGAVKDILDIWFKDLGMRRQDFHLTNTVLCRQPKEGLTGDQWRQAIACCSPRLSHEFAKMMHRKVILAFGDKALQKVLGYNKIAPWAGGPVWSKELKSWVIPSWHPFYATRQPAYLPVVKWLITRAKAFADGTLTEWQWPRMVTEPPYEDALLELSREKELSLDIEDAPILDRIRCIGVGTNRLAVSVPLPPEGSVTSRELAILRDILANPSTTKILQNGQHDRHTLEQAGWTVAGSFRDTMLMHTVVAPRLPHSLGFIAALETHAPCWKTEFHEADDKESGKTSWFTKAPLSDLLPYNAKDNIQQFNIYASLQEKLKKMHRGEALFAELSELDEIGWKMRKRGMMVSLENKEKHYKMMTEACEKFRQDFRKIVPDEQYDLGKSGQNPGLAKFFFETLKAPAVSYSEKTGNPSLDSSALNYYVGYFMEQGAPQLAALSRLILKYRQLTKLLSSYINKLPIEADGAVHPHWRPCKARTGRWAAKNPALQTIPKNKKRNDGSTIPGLRDLFCAREGFYLVKADYSQLELRIMALLAGDENLLRAYAEGQDVHQLTANAAFKCQATSSQRDRAKMVNYSLLYGSGDATIWKRLVVDIPELKLEHVAHLRKTFFTLFPQIKVWQEQLLKNSENTGYVEAPISGRRQYYNDGRIVPTEILNFPIQATAGDLANLAMRTIAAKVDWVDTHILTQVHDEIMLECRDPEFGLALLREGMEQEITIGEAKMVFPIDCSIGTNWGSCQKEKDWRKAK